MSRRRVSGKQDEAWLDGLVLAAAAFVIAVGCYGIYDLLLAPQVLGRGGAIDPSRRDQPSGALLGNVLSSAGMELCPGKSQVNIMVLGTDERREGGRADTIIVVMIRKDTKRAAAISIPRDLKVRIPGYGTQKINAVYAFNRRKGTGELMTLRAVEAMFQQQVGYPLQIDYYVKTDVEKFPRLFDENALGGLNLYVDRPMNYHDRHGGLHIDLEQGHQYLDGDQIEGFVRHRHDRRRRNESTDYMRNQRQQYVLKEVVKQKAKATTLTRLPEIVRRLEDMVSTDMTVAELVALANLARQIDLENVTSRVIATVADNTGHGWYAVLRPRETLARMQEIDEALAGGVIGEDPDAEANPRVGDRAMQEAEEDGEDGEDGEDEED